MLRRDGDGSSSHDFSRRFSRRSASAAFSYVADRIVNLQAIVQYTGFVLLRCKLFNCSNMGRMGIARPRSLTE